MALYNTLIKSTSIKPVACRNWPRVMSALCFDHFHYVIVTEVPTPTSDWIENSCTRRFGPLRPSPMPCPLVRAFVMTHGMEGDHPGDLGATTREALLSGNLRWQ